MSDNDTPLDCDLLNNLFFDCRKYIEDPELNLESFVRLKKYENELVLKRIDSIKKNDVWELRKEPPSDWNAPLPDWANERLKDTIWYKYKTKE